VNGTAPEATFKRQSGDYHWGISPTQPYTLLNNAYPTSGDQDSSPPNSSALPLNDAATPPSNAYPTTGGYGWQGQPPAAAPSFSQNSGPNSAQAVGSTGVEPQAAFPPESQIPDFEQPSTPINSVASGSPVIPAGQPPAGRTANADPAFVLAEERLKHLEQSVFGLNYSEHDLPSRLDHLERETFGNTTNGSIEERLLNLEAKIGGQPAFGDGTQTPTGQVAAARGGSICGSSDVAMIVQAIPSDPKAGDYFASIHPAAAGRFAYWDKFPVRVHLPQDSPEAWEKHLSNGIKKWSQFIPLNMVSSNESADIEVTWVNHLVPRLVGITRVVITDGHMHVQVFMLRPTFYLSEVPERALAQAFLHELGHALGLMGHSDTQSDVMYPFECAAGEKFPSRSGAISPRDINTLKRIYESPCLPANYTAPAPLEWGSCAH
jgi:predicted Zn-dependent protease